MKYHFIAAYRIRLKELLVCNCRDIASLQAMFIFFDYGSISDFILGLAQSGVGCGWNFLSSLRVFVALVARQTLITHQCFLAIAEQWWHSIDRKSVV